VGVARAVDAGDSALAFAHARTLVMDHERHSQFLYLCTARRLSTVLPALCGCDLVRATSLVRAVPEGDKDAVLPRSWASSRHQFWTEIPQTSPQDIERIQAFSAEKIAGLFPFKKAATQLEKNAAELLLRKTINREYVGTTVNRIEWRSDARRQVFAVVEVSSPQSQPPPYRVSDARLPLADGSEVTFALQTGPIGFGFLAIDATGDVQWHPDVMPFSPPDLNWTEAQIEA